LHDWAGYRTGFRRADGKILNSLAFYDLENCHARTWTAAVCNVRGKAMPRNTIIIGYPRNPMLGGAIGLWNWRFYRGDTAIQRAGEKAARPPKPNFCICMFDGHSGESAETWDDNRTGPIEISCIGVRCYCVRV